LSKRENLRLKLADAIERILGSSHELSIPNCLRYVKPHLRSFGIRDTTDISLDDWETSIELATLRIAKPTDQPTPLLKPRPIPQTFTEWRTHLLERLDTLLSRGTIIQEEYDLRRRIAEESYTKSQYSERLRTLAIESGT
jgi:hypothetical protein